jgi:transmembrane sensor
VPELADQLTDLSPLAREAIAWVVRLKSGAATTADAEEFRRWRATSPAHEAAFIQAVRLWRGFETVGMARLDQPKRLGADHRISRRAVLAGAAAVAAGGAGIMILRPPFDLWPSWRELSADYRTGKGEQREVRLGPDISLRLNTLTSIAVRSTPDQPRIELISGEALIDVAISTRAPLVLIAGTGDIRARQAKFYARCIDGHTSITCLTGSLEVGQGARLAQLSAGQQIAYSPREFEKSTAVDLTPVTAWESGMLVFRDATLAAVVAEINRYRPGRIVVVNAQLARRIVNATFHVGQLDNFLLQAKQLFGAKVTALPGGLVFLG